MKNKHIVRNFLIAFGLIVFSGIFSKCHAQGDFRYTNRYFLPPDTCRPAFCYTFRNTDTYQIYGALKQKFPHSLINDSCAPKSCFAFQNTDLYQIYGAIKGISGSLSNAWVNGLNAFGGISTFGTSDNNRIDFYSNNIFRGRLSSGGQWFFGNAVPGIALNTPLTAVGSTTTSASYAFNAVDASLTNNYFSLRNDSRIIYKDGNQANGYVLTSDVNGVATWQATGGATDTGAWSLSGNTTTFTRKLGTLSSNAVSFITNGIERLQLTGNGKAIWKTPFYDASTVLFLNTANRFLADSAGRKTASWYNGNLTLDSSYGAPAKFVYKDGSQANNYVLTSDANGKSTWTAPSRYVLGGNNLMNWVPMNTGSPNYLPYVLFSAKLPANVPAGSLLNINLTFEITNPTTYWIQDTWFVKYSDSPTDSAFSNYVMQPNGYNIGPNGYTHHGVQNGDNIYYCPIDMSNKYINVVVYYASTDYVTGDLMQIMGNGAPQTNTANLGTVYNWFNIKIDPPTVVKTDSLDISTRQWLSRVTTVPTNTFILALDSLIKGIKYDGNWQFDWFNVAGAAIDNYVVNIANPLGQKMTTHGSYTFTPYRYCQGDGATFYGSTTIEAKTNGNISLNSGLLGSYIQATPTAAGCPMGIIVTNDNYMYLSAAAVQGTLNFSNGGVPTSNVYATTAGWYTYTRSASNVVKWDKNGSVIFTNADASNGFPATGNTYYFHAANNIGAILFSPHKQTINIVGSGGIDRVKLNTRIQRFKTVVGF